MNVVGKWIRFNRHKQGVRKTALWAVETIEGNVILGHVTWHPGWCRFVFAAEKSGRAPLDPDCLREIATFCEAATAAHKQEKKNDRKSTQRSGAGPA